ncbi:GNAT family N-acetyltransferase [Cognatishimia sp. WU-CL00825]|uniref:GNAT family N-acetyltransferase n=1 Tax=Cognatishimia sp. WU-CL00825 TaxID=3127658 RepID=UPI0031045D63
MAKAQAGLATLTISQFDKALHDRSAFSCGFDPIDKFLKEALSDHLKSGYLTAYMAARDGQNDVIGFYTLSAFAVSPDHITPPKRPRPPPSIPATYIKVVAVHKDWQAKGIGTALMVHALRKALEISGQIGTMAIVLDVLRDANFVRRAEFYQALGFRPMRDPENPDRVYLSMKDVAATLGD